MATLEVLDHGELIIFSFEDLLKYHGRSAVGGVAHGFKVMERALPLLAGGEPPERYEIRVETAFEGPGARDAFEMVTRAVTGGHYRVDTGLAPPGVPESPNGRYFFRVFRPGGPGIDLTLRPGLVHDDFLELARRDRAPEEEQQMTRLKHEMADRLVALPATEVYDAAPGPA